MICEKIAARATPEKTMAEILQTVPRVHRLSPVGEKRFTLQLVMHGGEGGIRTPDTVTRMPHFECGAFNHSATSPGARAVARGL